MNHSLNRRFFLAAIAGGMFGMLLPGFETPDFSGQWKLNTEKSDDPREKMRGRFGRRGRRGGRPRGPGGGFEAPRTLKIEMNGAEVQFVYADRRSQTLYADGREQTLETPQGELVSSTTWNGSRLITTATTPGGRTLQRVYELKEEGRELQVRVETEHPRLGSIKMRFFYDFVEDEVTEKQ